MIGSTLTQFSLGVWLYQQTGAVTQFGFLYAFAFLPKILLSPFAGVIVDRLDRRLVMLLSDTIAGLGTLCLVFLLLHHQLHLWHLYTVTCISAAMAAFQLPALTASITLLVPKQNLGKASGMVQLSDAISQLLAPPLGGLLLGLIQLQGIVIIDGLTFIFAFITLLLLRIPKPPKTQDNNASDFSFFQDIFLGSQYISKRPALLSLLLFSCLDKWLVGMLMVLVTPLGLILAGPQQLGLVLSIGGSGMVAGSLMMSRWGGPTRLVLGVLRFNLLMGAALLLAGVHTYIPLLAVSAFSILFGLAVALSCDQAIWQKKVPAAIQGRVFSIRQMLGFSVLFTAYALAGILADRIFEPLMTNNGLLASSAGLLIGTGPGRGIGLMFVLLGLFALGVTIAAYFYRPLIHIDRYLPDAVSDAISDTPDTGTDTGVDVVPDTAVQHEGSLMAEATLEKSPLE